MPADRSASNTEKEHGAPLAKALDATLASMMDDRITSLQDYFETAGSQHAALESRLAELEAGSSQKELADSLEAAWQRIEQLEAEAAACRAEPGLAELEQDLAAVAEELQAVQVDVDTILAPDFAEAAVAAALQERGATADLQDKIASQLDDRDAALEQRASRRQITSMSLTFDRLRGAQPPRYHCVLAVRLLRPPIVAAHCGLCPPPHTPLHTHARTYHHTTPHTHIPGNQPVGLAGMLETDLARNVSTDTALSSLSSCCLCRRLAVFWFWASSVGTNRPLSPLQVFGGWKRLALQATESRKTGLRGTPPVPPAPISHPPSPQGRLLFHAPTFYRQLIANRLQR